VTADRVVTTAGAASAVERLGDAFSAAADPDRARAMAAYMRDQFEFFGIPTPLHDAVTALVKGLEASWT